MNILQLIKLISMGLAGTLLATGIVWTVNHGIKSGDMLGHSSPPAVTRAIAPEIDAASGTNAIALLIGVLLLAGERSRSRRS